MTNAGSQYKPRRRIMRTFKLDEISGVDMPAQEGATVVLMKRKSQSSVEKKAYLTTAVDGHSHLLDEVNYDGIYREHGTTSWSKSEGEEYGHEHPWVRLQDGTLVIGMAEGHTHEVIESTGVTKAQDAKTGEDKMTDAEKLAKAEADLAKAQADLAKAQAAEARSTAIAALTDVEKAHFNGLSDEGKTSFLAKSAEARKAEIAEVAKRASDVDPVVYTTRNGLEIRKSAGDALIAIAKDADEQAKQNEVLAKANAEAALRKRAEDLLPNLPGSIESRMEMLRGVEAITDVAKRDEAMAALKASNASMAGITKEIGSAGHSANDTADSPSAKLDALAKKRATENKVSYAKAYDEVLRTDEGAKLYAQSIQ